MKTSSIVLFTCLLFFNHDPSESAKILGLFTFPEKSQHVLGYALLQELARRGHEVTMISPYEEKNPPQGYTSIHLDDAMAIKEKYIKQGMQPNQTIVANFLTIMGNLDKLSTSVLDNHNVRQLLESGQQFDIAIHNLFVFNEALLGISHQLNATVIQFNAVGTVTWLNYHTSNPNPYSYVPHIGLTLGEDMTFFERLQNTVINIFGDIMMHYVNMPTQQRILAEYFPQAPPLNELCDDVALYMVNSHIATETPRPYLSNIVRVGGFHLQEVEQLPEKFKSFLDSASDGVVFFSLGSNLNCSEFAPEIIQGIINVFSTSKYKLIWKFDGELELPASMADRILLSTWLPQRAILAHPNVKVFITHSGLGGTVEAVYFGVPMICIPFFGDQRKNALDTVMNGYGVLLEYHKLGERTLAEALHEITSNPTYVQNMRAKSDLYRHQEMNPMDKAIYWIEHVIRLRQIGGLSHLKSKATKIPWYQYFLLDQVAFIAITFTILFITIKQMCCSLFGKTENTKHKKFKRH